MYVCFCKCMCGSMKTMARLCGKLCELSSCRQLLNINKETNMSNGRPSIPSGYGTAAALCSGIERVEGSDSNASNARLALCPARRLAHQAFINSTANGSNKVFTLCFQSCLHLYLGLPLSSARILALLCHKGPRIMSQAK